MLQGIGKGHQPLSNCGLLLGYRLTLRATNLIHNSEINIFSNVIINDINLYEDTYRLNAIFKTGSRAIWCPQAPC